MLDNTQQKGTMTELRCILDFTTSTCIIILSI